MAFNTSEQELTYSFNEISEEDMTLLARKFRMSDINGWIQQMMDAIALEAKSRIQSKIAILLNHGYGTGALFNSIYYKIQGDQIVLSSTKNYFAILNAGYSSFNIADSLKNKGYSYATMRLPGGRTIYRKLPLNEAHNGKKKQSASSATWIHPGWKGVDIYKTVAVEMQGFIQSTVNTRIDELKREAETLPDLYQPVPDSSRTYYAHRNESGQFSKSPDNLSAHQKMMENNSRFRYVYNANGSVTAEMEEGWNENIAGWQGANEDWD